MQRSGRPRAPARATLLLVLALLGAAVALQLAAGGIRGRALGPDVLALSVCALGGLLMVHRPGLRLGRVLAVTGIGFGLGALGAGVLDYGARHPIPRPVAEAAFATVSLTRILVATWVLFILWFPEDRFAGRGWRRFFVLSAAACAAVALATWLVGPADRVFDFYSGTSVPAGAGGPFAGAWPAIGRLSDLLLLLPLIALGSLVQRYRHGGDVVAQQVRWLLVATGTEIVVQLAAVALSAQRGAAPTAGLALSIAAQPLPMLAATAAILRYRLWDIELVVSRALVYALLWAALSALLLVPPLAAGLLVGGRDALAAVGMALVVTLVFQPARTRLERLAERVVYRHRRRPHALLAQFWETLRSADIERVGGLLAETAQQGLGLRWAGVWLFAGDGRRGGSLQPLGLAGAGAGAFPPAVLPAAVVERLHAAPGLVPDELPEPLGPERPAAVVSLVAADELVGVLACGPRPGDSLGATDYQFLELLARGSALRLRNLRLEAQLRERLAEIEVQAQELRRSRRRLVATQDDERRRIERDLHDGVQQQLVSLAIRLKRAAEGSPLLADLADEAEQAVFALQELARGIYPGVLVDQGLPAALRTQAARLPLAVQLDVDPALAGRRLDAETETALYFVALEALTNAQKHAPGARVAVCLRTEGEHVVLEIVDDGPGFEGRGPRGTGLQNMADRIAAAGGTFAIESRSGAGTRVTTSVPAREPLLQVDSRR